MAPTEFFELDMAPAVRGSLYAERGSVSGALTCLPCCSRPAHGSSKVLHAIGVPGRYVEVLAQPVDQAVCLDCVAAGKRQRVGTAHGEYISRQATVQVGEVQAAARAL